MAQLNKNDTFVNGQTLTADRLNLLIDEATINSNVIIEQPNLDANTVATNDSVLLYDLSALSLKEATASDLLNSNIPVTTSSVSSATYKDIIATASSAVTVTGAIYTSADGLSVTVTKTAHGLVVGQIVLISNAGTGYNGSFRITTAGADTFSYAMQYAATPATSVSCVYTKTGSLVLNGNSSISGSGFINGDSTVVGNFAVNGNTLQTGSVTQNGTVNITGAIQYNGTPVYGLYEILEVGLPTTPYVQTGTTNALLYTTSEVSAKPSDEIWEYECSFHYSCNGYPAKLGVRYSTQNAYSNAYLAVESYQDANGGSSTVIRKFQQRWIIKNGVSQAATTYSIDAYTGNGQTLSVFINTTAFDGIGGWTGALAQPKIRIYKYKTA